MTDKKKKHSVIKTAGRVFAWFTAFVLTIILLVQVALFGGIWWLNSENGYEWTQSYISQALEGTGYSLDIGRFHYSALTKLAVNSFTLSYEDKKVLSGKNVKIGVDVFSLAASDLSIDLYADTLTWFSIPEEDNTNEPASLAVPSFTLPDMYFSSVALDRIRVKEMMIKENVIGVPLGLSPDIEISADMDGDKQLGLKARFELYPENPSSPPPEWLPRTGHFDGTLQTVSSRMDVNELNITSPLYRINTDGDIGLKDEGDIDLAVVIKVDELSQLSEEIKGSASFDGTLTGTANELKLIANTDINITNRSEIKRITGDFVIDNILSEDISGTADLAARAYERDIVLESNWLYSGDSLQLNNLTATAPSIDLAGDLAININTALVEGELSADINSLTAYEDILGVPVQATGNIQASFYPSDNNQGVRFTSDWQDVSYEGITADTANIEADIGNIVNPLYSDFTVRLQDIQYGEIYVESLRLDTDVYQQNDFIFTISAKGDYHRLFNIEGSAMMTRWVGDAPTLKNIQIDGSFADSPFIIAGDLHRNTADIRLVIEDVPIAPLFPDAPAFISGAVATGETTLKGPLQTPELNSDLTIESRYAQAEDESITLTLNARFKDELTSVSLSGSGTGLNNFYGDFTVPMEFSIEPFNVNIKPNATLAGNMEGSVQMDPLADLFLSPAHEVSGQMSISASLQGTLDNPDLAGDIILDDAFYRNMTFGLILRNIDAQARLNNESVILERFYATDQENGTINGSGQVDFANMAAETDISLKANNIHLLKGETVDGTISGNLSLQGQNERMVLSGDLTASQMDIAMPEQFDSNIPELNIINDEDFQAEENDRSLALDVTFTADDRVFLRGWGLEVEMAGSLDVTGTVDEPLVNGTLSSKRGRFEEFGKQFEIVRANLQFQGQVPPSPYLDVKVETTEDDLTAYLTLTGSITDPDVNISSTPSLPDDQVISRVLFGEDIAQISPFQAVQLAQTMRRFTGGGGGGFDPIGALRDATGLDNLSIDSDAESGTSVGVGKYLTDEVYLELENGSGEDAGAAANVEVELTPNITLESQVGTQSGGGIFWSWDY